MHGETIKKRKKGGLAEPEGIPP